MKSISIQYTMLGSAKGSEYLCEALFRHGLILLYTFLFFFFLGNHRLLLSKHRKGDARRSLALHHHRGQHVSSF